MRFYRYVEFPTYRHITPTILSQYTLLIAIKDGLLKSKETSSFGELGLIGDNRRVRLFDLRVLEKRGGSPLVNRCLEESKVAFLIIRKYKPGQQTIEAEEHADMMMKRYKMGQYRQDEVKIALEEVKKTHYSTGLTFIPSNKAVDVHMAFSSMTLSGKKTDKEETKGNWNINGEFIVPSSKKDDFLLKEPRVMMKATTPVKKVEKHSPSRARSQSRNRENYF